jgi:hypothetical protein
MANWDATKLLKSISTPFIHLVFIKQVTFLSSRGYQVLAAVCLDVVLFFAFENFLHLNFPNHGRFVVGVKYMYVWEYRYCVHTCYVDIVH